MSQPIRIIGQMIVHNEDRFLRRAALNIADFCDRVLIAEHRSNDGTPEICAELARQNPKFEVSRIRDPREASEILQPFANTPSWVFGVDGDEIYDPAGLAWMRARLTAGEFARWWVIFGNVCNCVALDEAAKTARGYLAPPCRSMTKLYNFAALERLDPDAPQPFGGSRDVFHPGHDYSARYELYQESPWETARFRCLHVCFMQRSSRQAADELARENMSERRRLSPLTLLRRAALKLTGRGAESPWKREKYMRGPLVDVDAAPFLT
jgi:hypothetical protein